MKKMSAWLAPGQPTLMTSAFDLESVGYETEEFFFSGTASSYAPISELGSDGRWDVAPSGLADYTSRLVVVRPTDPAKCNGAIIVEWLNVTAGLDAPTEWMIAHREIVREGYIYIAVSAQQVGVQGGVSRGKIDMSLKTIDADRYAMLDHPGDAYAYDIFSQAGRLIREGQGNGILGALNPQVVLAAGESQGAMFLTTYVNALDHHARVYDGFLIHSRFAPAGPLDGSSIYGDPVAGMSKAPRFRSDLRVPLLAVITETDLIGGPRQGYYLARQPDNEMLRIWEIPGTAHADNYIVQVAHVDTGFAPIADLAAAYAPTRELMGQQLQAPINFAPQHHYVLQAALAKLHVWTRDGIAAPMAERLRMIDGDSPQLILDGIGVAMGGVRTPWVDAPIAKTSGIANREDPIASMFGTGELFDSTTLMRLYPGGKSEYLALFQRALDNAIAAGFILASDSREIRDLAAAMYTDG